MIAETDVRGHLLGREQELCAIVQSCAGLDRGDGALLLIDGAAGTGKSSLLLALRRAAGADVLATTAVELDTALPLAAAGRLLGQALRARAADTNAPPHAAVALHALAETGTGSSAAVEGGVAAVHALAGAAVELLEHRGRLVLVVDDAHLADRQSLRLLELLAELTPEAPLLLACAWRRGELDAQRLAATPGARLLDLSDLDEATSAELVARRLPGADAEFLAACGRVTGGNPFLLRELSDLVVQSDLTPDAATAARIGELVPRTVTRGVLIRLGRLAPKCADVARAVAVLGDGAPLRHVAALAHTDLDTAAAEADALVAVEILAGDRMLAFRHPLLAASVLDDLGPFTRARWYRRAAEITAAEGLVDRAGAHLLRADAAGEPETVAILRSAAARAFATGAARTAQRLLERALAEPPPAERRAALLLDLARAEAALGEQAAIAHLDEALAALADPGERSEALCGLARLQYMRLDFKRAADLAARGLDELAPDDPRTEQLRAIWVIAAGMNPQSALASQRVIAEYAAAAVAGDAIDEPDLAGAVAIHLAARFGAPDVVARMAETALERDAAASGDGLAVGIELALAALLYCDRLAAAAHHAAAALVAARTRGSMLDAAAACAARGLTRLWRGDLAGAEQDAGIALLPGRYGWTATVGQAALLSARIALARDDLEGARAAIALADDLEAPHPPLALTAALVELSAGDPSAALELSNRAGDWQESIWRVESPAVVAWRSTAALALLQLGRRGDAERLARAELTLADRTSVNAVRARALRTCGLVLGGDEGLDLLRRAAETASAAENLLERLESDVELGSALRRAGQRRNARAVLAPARADAERLGFVALARRAADEQRASGARLRRVPLSGIASLTPSERRVADLAAAGATNREIAAQLFLTAKTVEWHLGHVFAKLGVKSRRELPRALADEAR